MKSLLETFSLIPMVDQASSLKEFVKNVFLNLHLLYVIDQAAQKHDFSHVRYHALVQSSPHVSSSRKCHDAFT